MKLLSIIYVDDGRKLKHICQWLIKSWACTKIFISNYIHSYRASDWKWLTKDQHKLIQIHFDDPNKLIIMLNKLMPGWQEDYRVCDINTL